MEKIKTEQQKVFENFSKEERKLLRKEFDKNVETRFKIFFWSGIALLFLTLVSAGFSIYYMLNIFMAGTVALQFYICAALVTIGGFGALLCTSQYHKKFHTWLKDRTNGDVTNGDGGVC